MIRTFFDLLKKESKSGGLAVFTTKEGIFVFLDKLGVVGKSMNGFDFERVSDKEKKIAKKWEKIRKRRLVEGLVYQNVVVEGSERMDREKIEVEGVIREKNYNLVFFSFEKEKGVCEVGVLATESYDSGKIKWRNTEPVWGSPEKWKGRKVRSV